MSDHDLSPAAEAFLLQWTPTDTELCNMRADLAALLETVRAEEREAQWDRLYRYLCGFRIGIDADEKAGKLTTIQAAAMRVVVNTLIQGLMLGTRTGQAPWDAGAEGTVSEAAPPPVDEHVGSVLEREAEKIRRKE